MNDKVKFNFATVLSMMVMLVYAYFGFMGLVYWRNGEVWLPLGVTLAFVVMIVLLLWLLRAAKASRVGLYRVGGQWLCGILIVGIFVAQAIPFSNFTRVIENQETISRTVNAVYDGARKLDETYVDYASTRISRYEQQLKMISSGQRSNPDMYQECLGGAGGNTDDEKIKNLSRSLKMKLLPDQIVKVQQQRADWLKSVHNMSVWNVLLASNLQKIGTEVQNWTGNYERLSSEIYKGEKATVFTYPQFNTDLKAVTASYSQLGTPTRLSLILAIVAALIIIVLPYILQADDPATHTTPSDGENDEDKYM